MGSCSSARSKLYKMDKDTIRGNLLICRLIVESSLDSNAYVESDKMLLSLSVHRTGGSGGQAHGIRRVKINMVQQVGVAMFSTGNFKNVVGCTTIEINPAESSFADEVSDRVSE